MAIIYYSLMWFSLGLLLGGLYEQHRNNKVVKNTSTNNAIMPCANCSKCHWFNHCVCTFGSQVCRCKYEPRTAQ